MKLFNSLGFLSIGSILFLLPELAPSLCPTDMFGNSVRETWLHVMGLTQVVIGASFLARKAGAEFAGWLERWPELISAQAAGMDFDPVQQAGVPALVRVSAEPFGEVIPMDFKPGWSDQRRAA
ncbi:MAG: hypothetical protein ABIZ81_06605 [Opitutaceae bacterium]